MHNTGAPQRCVLIPVLYSLFTHDCVAMHASNSIIKFADDTTVVGLITNNDDSEEGGGEGPRSVVSGVSKINSLNVNKTKEMIVDFRKQQRAQPPSTSTGQQWRWKVLSSSAYTSQPN